MVTYSDESAYQYSTVRYVLARGISRLEHRSQPRCRCEAEDEDELPDAINVAKLIDHVLRFSQTSLRAPSFVWFKSSRKWSQQFMRGQERKTVRQVLEPCLTLFEPHPELSEDTILFRLLARRPRGELLPRSEAAFVCREFDSLLAFTKAGHVFKLQA